MHPLLCVVFVKVPNQVCILPQIHTLPTKKQKKCNSVESLSSELNVFGGGKKKVARPTLSFFVFFPRCSWTQVQWRFQIMQKKGTRQWTLWFVCLWSSSHQQSDWLNAAVTHSNLISFLPSEINQKTSKVSHLSVYVNRVECHPIQCYANPLKYWFPPPTNSKWRACGLAASRLCQRSRWSRLNELHLWVLFLQFPMRLHEKLTVGMLTWSKRATRVEKLWGWLDDDVTPCRVVTCDSGALRSQLAK